MPNFTKEKTKSIFKPSMKSYKYYLLIIIVIAIGFALGAYIAFGIQYMDLMQTQVASPYGRFLVQLFGMGMLGGSTFCAYFLINDLHESVYENNKYYPHFFDFASYLFIIFSSGVTGIILYLILKTGIKVGVTNNSQVDLSFEASLLISYIGGYCAFKVQNQINKIANSIFNDEEIKQNTNNTAQEKNNSEEKNQQT